MFNGSPTFCKVFLRQSPVAYSVLPSEYLAISVGQKRKLAVRKMLNKKGLNKEPCRIPLIIFR